jgi:glutathione S-transferase
LRFHNPSHVPDATVVSNFREQLVRVFKIYDTILGKQKFIGGETFTIGDIYHLPYLTLLKNTGEDKLWDRLENVKRWAEEILNRPSWVKVTSMGK